MSFIFPQLEQQIINTNLAALNEKYLQATESSLALLLPLSNTMMLTAAMKSCRVNRKQHHFMPKYLNIFALCPENFIKI